MMGTSKATVSGISIDNAIEMIESRNTKLRDLEELWKQCLEDKKFRGKLANTTGWGDFYLEVMIRGKIADLKQRGQTMRRSGH